MPLILNGLPPWHFAVAGAVISVVTLVLLVRGGLGSDPLGKEGLAALTAEGYGVGQCCCSRFIAMLGLFAIPPSSACPASY